MPSKKSRPRRSPASPLTEAREELLTRFDKVLRDELGPLLGKVRLAAVKRDLAIASNVGGGVVMHAGLAPNGEMTLQRVMKEKPVVGVVATTIPLYDPVTLQELAPGAYVVRLRAVGRDTMAFDFFKDRDRPVYSTVAVAKQQGPPTPWYGLLDVDIEWPWDPDSMYPPGDTTDGKFCLSFLIWKHCWNWNWPDIKWPW